MKVLYKIDKSFGNSEFQEDFADMSKDLMKMVEGTIEMVKKREEPSKIKKALADIKSLAVGVSGSIIATGICGLIEKLPIW